VSEQLPEMKQMLLEEHEKVMAKTLTTSLLYQRVDLTAAQIQEWYPRVQTVVFPETQMAVLNLKGVNENHDNSN